MKSCSSLSGWQRNYGAPLYTVKPLQHMLTLMSYLIYKIIRLYVNDFFPFLTLSGMMQNSSAENVPDYLNGRGHSAVIGLVTSSG